MEDNMSWFDKAVVLYNNGVYKTARQKQVIDAVVRNGRVKSAAQELGVEPKSIRDVLKSAWNYYTTNQYGGNVVSSFDGPIGNVVNFDTVEPSTEDYLVVKGKSVLYDTDGNVKLEWVKTALDDQAYFKAVKASIEAMKEEIAPVKIDSDLKPVSKPDDSLLTQYIITDYHLGMLSWGEETGSDWDIKVAENSLIKFFKKAIEDSPPSKTGLLVNLGDFLHYDSLEAITPSSGHILDVDSRYQMVVRTAIRLIRQIVNMMLQKHEKIKIIMAEGNHDLASSAWLRELFYALYEGNERIEVDTNPTPYYCHKHGKTLLFYHHGHKKNLNGVHEVFARLYKKEFGDSNHVYAHVGHLHHAQLKETNLMVVEQHRTLAAPDAYAVRGGWLSGRSATVIVYHDVHGEIERKIYNFDYINK